jgi:hypothetical protein
LVEEFDAPARDLGEAALISAAVNRSASGKQSWLDVAITPVQARIALAAGCLFCFAALGWLYAHAPSWYFRVLSPLFYFDHPFRYPFHDIGGVMATLDCWRQGVDVYISNPCDVENRAWPYSPLLLRLGFLPSDRALLGRVGVAVGLAFIAAVVCLPAGRRRRSVILIVAAALSPAAIFAVERANLDAVIFALLASAGVCMRGHRIGRTAAYSLVAVAGFLKYYPFVALLLALRERLAQLAILAVVVVMAMGAFAWQFQLELSKALVVIGTMNTHWGPFSDRFGARQFADGLGAMMAGLPPAAAVELAHVQRASAAPSWALMGPLLLMSWLVVHLQRQPAFRDRLAAMPAGDQNFLVLGCVTLSGCFIAGYSNAYRAILLLLALPGLIELGASAESRWLRWAPALVLYSMWAMPVQHIIQVTANFAGQPTVGRWLLIVDWTAHEIAWWWLVGLCVAILLQFVVNSRSGLTLRSRLEAAP